MEQLRRTWRSTSSIAAGTPSSDLTQESYLKGWMIGHDIVACDFADRNALVWLNHVAAIVIDEFDGHHATVLATRRLADQSDLRATLLDGVLVAARESLSLSLGIPRVISSRREVSARTIWIRIDGNRQRPSVRDRTLEGIAALLHDLAGGDGDRRRIDQDAVLRHQGRPRVFVNRKGCPKWPPFRSTNGPLFG